MGGILDHGRVAVDGREGWWEFQGARHSGVASSEVLYCDLVSGLGV